MSEPIFQRRFIATRAYRQIEEELMKDPELNSVVVSGPSGSGKSTLAKEICAKLYHKKSTLRKYYLFNCSSLESFYGDLRSFYQDIAHRNEILRRDASWDILQDFYTVVNNKFPRHEKFFIFDDVEEEVDQMLEHLNHICVKLNASEDQKPLWKCLVTSEEDIHLPQTFTDMKRRSFISIEGFDLEETKKLFQRYDDETVELAEEIREVVGELPLALTIFLTSFASDQFESNKSLFIRNYLRDLENQTRILTEKVPHKSTQEASVLIAIKLSIERLLNGLKFPDESRKVLEMLSLLNQKNISTELLLACAETVTETPEMARMMIQDMMSGLVKRGLSSGKTENNVRLLSLHKLVKESLKQIVDRSELIPLIQKTLIALTRVMPMDGRRHKTCLVGFYADHGSSVDQEIEKVKADINYENTPFILYLHCHLLVGMGYCLLAQRNKLAEGVERLTQARDKYCELIHGRGVGYESLIRDSRCTLPGVDKRLAIELYEAGQSLSMMSDPDYLQYIRELPLYHRLTTKDVANMSGVKEDELVNGHLVMQNLRQFKDHCREMMVIEVDQLKKVAVAALLAQIYSVWSKVHGKRDEFVDISWKEECIHQAEAAVEVYNRIFSDSKPRVYLLSALITERELLTLNLDTTNSCDEVERISQQLEELSAVGNKPDKRLAYEAGLMRSNLTKDHYHKLLCKEAEIKCQGRLYQLGGGDRYYEKGKELLNEVKELTRLQVHKHSALSFAYKNFASFLWHCKRYGDAMIYIIKAMQELHEHVKRSQSSSDASNNSSNGSGDGPHPELYHPRFQTLYSNLQPYFGKYLDVKGADDKLLYALTDEAQYLWRIVPVLNEMGGGNQPDNANSMFIVLSDIAEDEIRDVNAVAVPEGGVQLP